MKNSLRSLLTLPNFVTLLNAISGLASIYFSLHREFGLAMGFLFLSVIWDSLDGRIARILAKRGKHNIGGAELDSLADIISFAVAPVLFAFQLNSEWYALVIYILFVCSALLRLARFHALNIKGFIGTPVTLNGIIIPLFYFLLPMFLSSYIWALYLLLAITMISPIKIKKLG